MFLTPGFSLFGSGDENGNGASVADLQLRHWLSDTPIYFEALEIIAEKSRSWWWGQQLDFATVSWTALLAIEGRRRRVPHLWTYALLPHLVSLSFAQNLFYVALLLTPSPRPAKTPEDRHTKMGSSSQLLDRIFPQKPSNWFPKLTLLLAPLALNYVVIASLPSTAGTAWFPTAVAGSKLLTLAPLILVAVAPESWGTVHPDPHDAYRGITGLFSTISLASGFFHGTTTVSGLLYNPRESYKHRHSIKIPFDTERRSKWEQSATAVEKVLGSVADHPAVAAAGKDVLLCALSLGLWAAVRAVDAVGMLHAAIPSRLQAMLVSSPAGVADAVAKPESVRPAVREEPQKPSGMTLRRRGRPAKTSVSSISSLDEPADGVTPTPRRRGRPRKAKPGPEPEPEKMVEDGTHEPPAVLKEEAELADVVPDDDFDWESAALAWGVTVLGGLGVASAAVFGAECISR